MCGTVQMSHRRDATIAARAPVFTVNPRMTTANSASPRVQGQFIAVVSHELRYPLTPIQNAAALLRHGPADPATVRRAAEIIERQVTGMDRLIGDLVDVCSIHFGVLEVRRARARLSGIVDLALASAGEIATERGHTMVVSVSPQPVYLDVDVTRLARALHHVIANASKYTDRHGHIHVRAQREGAVAVITVSDTGVGIAAEDHESIFGPFVRFDPRGRNEAGLGIGLYLARNVIEAHGGTISVESSPGKGSVFTVRVPCEALTTR